MLLFKSEFDRNGRFGHQFYRILTSVLLAEYFNGLFVEPMFKYFAYKANDYLSFSNHPRCALHIPSCTFLNYTEGQVDMYGNDKLNLSDHSAYQRFMASLSRLNTSANAVLVNLPYDQEPGKLLDLHFTDSKIRTNLSSLMSTKSITAKTCPKTIVIHIRRGDVTRNRFPSWYIEDDVYLHLIMSLYQTIGRFRLDIVTQGQLSFASQLREFPLVTIYNSTDCLNHQDEIRDLQLLSNASVIIGGQSTFSQVPSLIYNIPFIELVKGNNGQHQPHMFKPAFTFSTDMVYQNPSYIARTVVDLLDKS